MKTSKIQLTKVILNFWGVKIIKLAFLRGIFWIAYCMSIL
jgi:hypothetical protein